MSSPPPIAAPSDTSKPKSPSPGIPRIIRAHFPPDHLMSRDEVIKCHNTILYDRDMPAHTKELISEHMNKVEREGLRSDYEVPAAEADAWDWLNPYLIKNEGEEG